MQRPAQDDGLITCTQDLLEESKALPQSNFCLENSLLVSQKLPQTPHSLILQYLKRHLSFQFYWGLFWELHSFLLHSPSARDDMQAKCQPGVSP